jgi:glutamate dehydrogenase
VLELGCRWREAALVRALARYRQQSRPRPQREVQEQALCRLPGRRPADPRPVPHQVRSGRAADLAARELEQAKAVEAEITEALQAVASLDDDRGPAPHRRPGRRDPADQLLPGRRGRRPKPYISFKVASRELADLPAPKPYREIYVAAPHVEGVHLRFGPVARGGLRWSDRRDDFRTEVLGW